jgi:ribosome-associated protein
LKEWRRRYPDDAIFFIAGSDIFITVGEWQNCHELFDLANFIVANREVSFETVMSSIPRKLTERIVDFNEYNLSKSGRIILYTMDPVKVSSTLVRGAFAKPSAMKLNFVEELSEDVYNYISEKNLYEGGAMRVVKQLCGLIDDKRGEDIVSFDLRGVSSVVDYLVIATGKVDTHVKAISEHVMTEMKKNGIQPLAHEGLSDGVWVCIDYGDIMLHIMRGMEREYYNLEGIWGGAPRAL